MSSKINEQSDKTENKLQNFLKSSEMRSALTDSAEIAFDKILETDNEIFQKIPIIKTILALVAYTKDVKERFFLKKFKRFIEGFNDADQYLRERIESTLPDPQDKEDIAEHLVIYLQRFEHIKKADILCKLFLARCYGVISHEEFERLTVALDRIDINDINILKQFYEDDNAYEHLNNPKGFKWDENALWSEHRMILRSLLNVKLVTVDYSGAPKTGQIYPRSGGGGEAFGRNSLGEKFIKVLTFNLKQKD